MNKPSPKVLVIADDCAVRELVADHLSHQGYQVEQVPKRRDLVARAIQLRPQIIVFGMRPLARTDRQLLIDLQENAQTSKIPVIVFTTLRNLIDQARKDAQGKELLVLPFDLSTLEEKVARALGLPPRMTTT